MAGSLRNGASRGKRRVIETLGQPLLLRYGRHIHDEAESGYFWGRAKKTNRSVVSSVRACCSVPKTQS